MRRQHPKEPKHWGTPVEGKPQTDWEWASGEARGKEEHRDQKQKENHVLSQEGSTAESYNNINAKQPLDLEMMISGSSIESLVSDQFGNYTIRIIEIIILYVDLHKFTKNIYT